VTVRVEAVNLMTEGMKAVLPALASQTLQAAVMFVCSDGGVMFVGIKLRKLAVGEKFACVLFESDIVCRF
jgi:hypothetical protein